MKEALGVVLAGGAGERLWPLTRDRAKPAVPFGGIYRIIDVALSNCINSDLRRIFILTQYKSLSLNRHIRWGWVNLVSPELGEFVDVIPPQMRVSNNWYLGTADAVYQNIYSIGSERSRFVLILSGDHIYKMNYQRMLEQHVAAGAEVTVATIEEDPSEAHRLGVVEVDRDGRIVGFQEKPTQPKRSVERPEKIHASMGVYVFNTHTLIPILLADAEDPHSTHDFGRDVLPKIVETHRVFSFNFIDENKKEAQYWRDVGTLDAYYEANMDLVAVTPVFNLYDQSWPLRTYQEQLPPAKFVFADPDRMGVALDSIISPGCILSGGRVSLSVLSFDVRVNSYSEIENSIIFPHVNIGRNARLRRAIVDRHVSVPEGEEIGFDLEKDRQRYFVTDSGIVIVVRDSAAFEEPE